MVTYQVLQQSVFHPSYLISINTLSSTRDRKAGVTLHSFLSFLTCKHKKQLKVYTQPFRARFHFSTQELVLEAGRGLW